MCDPRNVHTAGSGVCGKWNYVHLGLLGMDGCPFISTEVPACGKTLWGGGWEDGGKEAWEKQSWLGTLLRSRTACSLKTQTDRQTDRQNSMLPEDGSTPAFKSKKDRRKDMIFKRGHSFLSSFQCLWGCSWWCLLGLLAVTLDQSPRARRRAAISGQCSPLPLGYKRRFVLGAR